MQSSILRGMWLLRFLIIVIILAGLIYLVSLVHSSLKMSVDHRIEKAMSVWVTQMRGQAKLVVADEVFTARVDRWDTKYFLKLYLGTTEVHIRVDGCRVQYIIEADQIRQNDWRYDPAGKVLHLDLPHPVLDEEMVDIPSDPRQWWVRKSSGWLRWDKDEVEEQLRQEIRPDVLAQARRAGWDATLDCAARARLQEALRKALEVPDLSVKVQWR